MSPLPYSAPPLSEDPVIPFSLHFLIPLLPLEFATLQIKLRSKAVSCMQGSCWFAFAECERLGTLQHSEWSCRSGRLQGLHCSVLSFLPRAHLFILLAITLGMPRVGLEMRSMQQ